MSDGVFVQDQDKLTSDVNKALFPKKKIKDKFLEEFKKKQKIIAKKIFGD